MLTHRCSTPILPAITPLSPTLSELETSLLIVIAHLGCVRKRRCRLALATVALSSLNRGSTLLSARGAPGGSGQKETDLKARNNKNTTLANCILDLKKLKTEENCLIRVLHPWFPTISVSRI